MISICGNYQKLSRNDLHHIPITPRGQRSHIWKGIQHGELIEQILDVLRSDFGITPGCEQYAVSPNQSVLIGSLSLLHDGKPMLADQSPNPLQYCLGIRHSNDSRYAVTGVAGGQILVCENGIVAGQDKWKAKHTKNFSIRKFVLDGISRFFDRIKSLNESLNTLSGTELSTEEFDLLLLKLARGKILPWRLLGEVDRLWLNPTDNPHFCGPTLWDWYNTTNSVIKRLPLIDQLDSLNRSYQLALAI